MTICNCERRKTLLKTKQNKIFYSYYTSHQIIIVLSQPNSPSLIPSLPPPLPHRSPSHPLLHLPNHPPSHPSTPCLSPPLLHPPQPLPHVSPLPHTHLTHVSPLLHTHLPHVSPLPYSTPPTSSHLTFQPPLPYPPTHTQAQNIPGAIANLNKLQDLRLQDMYVTKWNTSVLRHVGATLTSLTLANTIVPAWSEWLELFPLLSQLTTENAPLGFVPDDVFDKNSDTLRRVTLKAAGLNSVPSALTALVNLEELDLSDNHLTSSKDLAYELIPHLPTLKSLSLSGNLLQDIPRISFLGNLTRLNLSHNGISDVTAGLTGTHSTAMTSAHVTNIALPGSLSVLDLSHNQFRETPKVILGLARLRVLNLAQNAISVVRGDQFPVDSGLQQLYLQRNPLTSVASDAFHRLQHLKVLDLSGTKLTRLPLALGELSGLEILDVRDVSVLVCTCVESALRPWAQSLPQLLLLGHCGEIPVTFFFHVLASQCPPS